MKKFLLFLLFANFCYAQNKVAGAYHISSGNPDDGGYNWIFTEDHKFMMFTFGYAMAGKWEEQGNDSLLLTPVAPEKPFTVFARYSPDVNGTKIMFNNFDINEDSYIGTAGNEVQPVLNDDANCLPYPLLENFKPFSTLVLGAKTRDGKDEFYKVQLGKYNDVAITYYDFSHRVPPFYAIIKDGKLRTEDSSAESSQRQDISKEDQGIMKGLDKIFIKRPDFVIMNRGYRQEEDRVFQGQVTPLEEYLKYNYDYHPETQTYTAKIKDENPEDEYHDMNTLYRYEKIELEKSADTYHKSPKSVFHITCEDQ